MDNYKCKDCKDTGWITMDDGGHGTMKRCKCYSAKRAEELMKKSGISLEFRKKTFENFDTRNIAQLVNAKNKSMKYIQNFKRYEGTKNNSIMFCGQTGAGKTHLGIAICNSLMSINVSVSYMAYRNAITKIKQKLVNEAEYEKELTKYMQSRVLYIDDLLKGKITESDINILYEIVNYRYMNNLPMIISTEKLIDGLLEFDEAIGSRIIEMCRRNIFVFEEDEDKGEELNYRLS